MVTAVDIQELGANVRIYGEIDDPAMRYFNPSIAFHDGKLKIAIRSCNFAVIKKGKWYFRDGNAYSKTDVLYGDLDPETLGVTNLKKLNLSDDSPTRIKVAGLEDVRLFSRSDGMHCIGFESDRLTRSLHNQSAALAEYLIDGHELKYLRTLDKLHKEVVEKNWCPSDIPSHKFDFTYSDTQVFKDGDVLGTPSTTQIHGGTQLLKQPDGTYISLVHEKKVDPTLGYVPRNKVIYDKYTYYHYLALHGKDGVITKLSKPFRFGTYENIEFAAGMVEYKDDLIISIGIRDCKYALVKVKKSRLIDLIEVK